MQTTSLTWLLSITTFLPLVFLIAAIGFVLAKRSDRSSAKLFAVMGLGIMLFLRIASFVFGILVARSVDPGEFAVYHGVYSIVSSVINMVALSLLIAAVFAGRDSSASDDEASQKPFPVANGNPYLPPAN